MPENQSYTEEIPRKRLERFAESCRDVVRHGLVFCSSGNASQREGEDLMLATSTRTWLEEIEPDQVAICRISDGECLNGLYPTVELGFHAGILRKRPDVDVVLHVQTPYATALGCLPSRPWNFHVIPEVPYYIGDIGRVDYSAPGSFELAEAVSRAVETYDLVLMENHGSTVVGQTFRDAIQKASFFELACQILLLGGDRTRPIPEREIQSLLELQQRRRQASQLGA